MSNPSGLRRQRGVLVVPQLEHFWPGAARGLRRSSSSLTTGDAGAASGVLERVTALAGSGSDWRARLAGGGGKLGEEDMARAQRHYTRTLKRKGKLE